MNTGQITLNKFLAQAGFCSRRKATDLIKNKKVTVNHIVTTEPYTKIKSHDMVCVENKEVILEKKIYILLNKPKNTISAAKDINSRKTVVDILKPAIQERIYPVGRLDRNTTGLLVMTNDGDLSQKLAHPKYNVTKVYQVTTDRSIRKKDVFTLLRGVALDDGFMKADDIHFPSLKKNIVCIAIHSGKNHIVKRLFKHLHYQVTKLDRINYAGLTKLGIQQGQWRHLTSEEITQLQNLKAI